MLKAKDLTSLENLEGDAPHWIDEDGNLYVGSIGQSVEDFLKEYNAPTAELPPLPIVLPAVTLWERMTETEAEQVAEVMKTQSVRTVQIFNNATTFRSDHELWPLLEEIATQLFGEERAEELLEGE